MLEPLAVSRDADCLLAVEFAEKAIEVGVSGLGWSLVLSLVGTVRGCEAFRIALLLQGKDTRSARIAIQERKDIILGLRAEPATRITHRGRPLGSKNKRPRAPRTP